jgi:hypothetical protein
MARHLDPAIRLAIGQAEGTQMEIAARFGVSQSAVSKIRAAFGKGRTKLDLEEDAPDIIRDNRSLRVIAADYGTSRDTIARIKNGDLYPWLDRTFLNAGFDPVDKPS